MRFFTNILSITRFFRISLTLLVLLLSIEAWSQNYPVTCTPIVKPSYSLKWSEISTSNDMFKVHLLLKDLTKSSVDVYLKIRLSGVGVDIRTVDGFIPSQTLTLIPGQPRMLTASDLAEYFNISNIVVDGVDISALYNGGRLPEGLYTWTVEAYEIDRNRQVSNTGMALMNVFKNYPPIINIPQDGAILPVTTPQNVLFSWTSRSTASLNAAQGKTYKLRIYPLNGDDDPNVVANSGIQPIEITTTTPYFNYGAGNIPLEKGKRYAVQVQEEDANGVDDYENEGKSQVVTFSYGKPCVAPEGMVINPIGKGRVELTCEASAEDTETYPITAWYKTQDAKIWNSVPFNGNSVVISGLKDKTPYEFKLSSACGDNTNTMAALKEGDLLPSGDPSTEPETFTIDDSEFDEEEPEVLDPAILDPYGIGIEINVDGTTKPVETVNEVLTKIIKPVCVNNFDAYESCSPNHPAAQIPTGTIPLASLAIGDVLGIYDYAVLVTQVSGGTALAGKGLVKLPFLDNAFMAVEFEGIKAWKTDDPNAKGGCVYDVPENGFHTRPINQKDLEDEKVDAVSKIIKLTDPTVFHGNLDKAVKEYVRLTTPPTTTPTTQQRQDLGVIAKGISVATSNWKDKFTEAFSAGGVPHDSNPKIKEIMDEMDGIINQLNTDIPNIKNGPSYPIIPDLKAKIDAIIEKIKALQQENTPKPPRIQNVLATNIGYNEATLTWQGDPRFTKYVISYKTADGGELLETVSGNRLDLKKLQENSQYGFKIEGYVGDEVVDTYENGAFKTLQNKIPMPENVKQLKVNDNTMTLTWDKNKLHESYKVVYKDKNGVERYISLGKENTVTLRELNPDENYTYSIVAVGGNLESDPATGGFMSSLCRGLIETPVTRIVEGTTITLTASNSCIDIISWNGLNVPTSQRNISIAPTVTTMYELECTIESKNGETKICNDKIEITVDKKCTDVVARATTYDVTQGEEVGLIVKGCSSDVVWRDERFTTVSTNKIWLNTPTISQTYAVYCKNSSGEACAFQLPKIIVKNPKCELTLFKNDLEAHKNVFTPVGSVEITALGCPNEGTIQWELDADNQIDGEVVSGELGRKYKISDIRGNKKATIRATCLLGNEICDSEQITVGRPTIKCGTLAELNPHKLIVDYATKTVKIATFTHYASLYGITWLNDNSEVKPCFTCDSRYLNKSFPIPEKPISFQGILHINGPGQSTSDDYDCPFSISYFPPQSEQTQTSPIIPLTECSSFEIVANPNVSTIVRGTEIILSTKGCDDGKNFGSVTWTQTIGVDGKVKPLTNTTYEATCVFAGQTIIAKKEIKVNYPVFAVSPLSKSIILGESVNLTASNCTDGEYQGIVKWSNNQEGASITVTPTKEGTNTYTATCFINDIQYQKPLGVVITVTRPVTNYLPPHPCDFSVRTNQPSYIAGVNATINVWGCAGWVKWQSDDNPNLWGQTAPPADNVSFTVPTGSISNSYTVQCGDIKGNPAYCKAKVWIWVNVTQPAIVNIPPPSFSIPQNLTKEDCSIYGSNKSPIFGIPTNAPDGTIPRTVIENNNKFAVWAIGGPKDWSTGKKPNEIAILDKVCISNGNTLTWYENEPRTIRNQTLSSTGAGFALFVPTPDKNKTYWGLCTKKDGSYCKISVTIDPSKIYSPNSIINIDDNVSNNRLATEDNSSNATATNCGFMTTQIAIGDILKNLICNNGKLVIEAPITTEKVETLKNTILQNPIFQDKGISLPPITDAVIAEITAGGSQCQTAIDGLVKDVIGTTLKEEFNDLAANQDWISDVVEESDAIEEAKEITSTDNRTQETFEWLSPLGSANARVAGVNDPCPTYLFAPNSKRINIPNITNCDVSLNGILRNFTKDGITYTAIYYAKSNKFLGYYQKSELKDINNDGKITESELKTEPSVWLRSLDYLPENSGIGRINEFLEQNETILKNKELLPEIKILLGQVPDIFDIVEKEGSAYTFRLDELKALLLKIKSSETLVPAIVSIVNDPALEDEDKVCKVYEFYNSITDAQKLVALNAYLDLATRKKLITLLSGYSLTGVVLPVGGCAFKSGGEGNLLSLIRTTPVNSSTHDVKEILAHLNTPSGSPLLETLISKIDYGDLVNAITYIEKRDDEAVELYDKVFSTLESGSIDDIEKHNFYLPSGGLFGKDFVGKPIYKFSYENGQVKVTKSIITEPKFELKSDGEGNQVLVQDGWKYSPEITYNLNPYDLVNVINTTGLSAIENDLGIKNGDFAYVPAITLVYTAQKQLNHDIIQSINLASVFVGAGLSINTIRAGATALALFEAAGAIGSGLQFGIGTGDIPLAYSDIVGYYNLCVGVGGLGLVAGQNLPKLGSWILKVKNSATTININRATALNFLKRLSSLKSSSLWTTIKPTTKENLLKLANYLASKGLNATETILDPIFYTNLAKLATYNNLKKVAIIPLFVLLQKTDIDVTTGLIRNLDNAVESRIVLAEGGKIGTSIETFTSASTFSTKPNIAGVINQTTETATGGLAKYSSVTDLESPAAWQSVSSSAVEMTQLSTTTHNIILLGSTTLGFVAFAQKKSSNDCDICVQPEREAICASLKALHTKGGGTEALKNEIQRKLCASLMSNTTLADVALELTKNTKTRINKFLDEVSSTCSGSNSFCSNNLTANIVKTWGDLFDKHTTNATYARKYWNTLSRFGYLNTIVQDYVIKFSDKPGEDESSKGTLQEFGDDLEPNNNNSNYENFNKFLNTYQLFAKGFVGYKTGVTVTKEQYDWMGEVLGQYYEETEPIRVKAEKWIDRSNNIAKTNKYLQDGKDFENQILSDLKDPNSAVYKKLIADNWIPDLNQRQILSQVQFCINSNATSCTQKGEYFIADFAFAKLITDNLGNPLNWDIIVADTKLSAGTDFTDNQNDAMRQSQFKIKVDKQFDINGRGIRFINDVSNPIPVIKTRREFIKIYSNGNKQFGGITE